MATYAKRVHEILEDLLVGSESFASVKESTLDEEEKKAGASCNPQDKALFLERVKTFTTSRWAGKTQDLSPLRCAQYGWQSDNTDLLKCVTCNATVYAGVPDDWDSSTYTEICDKIQQDLQLGHDHLCPWPANPCPPSFLSLPGFTPDQWRSEIRKAFAGLVGLQGSLPELDEDGVAGLRMLSNSCVEELLQHVFKHVPENEDHALFGKVAAILAVTGWTVIEPLAEDASINCSLCGKEAGLWNFKSIVNRSSKKAKAALDASQNSLVDLADAMSSNVSVKSESSNVSENMMSELAKLATSSDSLAQSDLLKPASSQESLVNLQVSDKQVMLVDCPAEEKDLSSFLPESRVPQQATPHGLMKELLLSSAPRSRSKSKYSDSVFSEVGSESFDKRLSESITEEEIVLERAATELPSLKPPSHAQQQWMKELLLLTAPQGPDTDPAESVTSEVGSVSFDRRLEMSSVLNSPRAVTPAGGFGGDEDDAANHTKTKRMRFQEPCSAYFNVIDEHRHWCPWIANAIGDGCSQPDLEVASPVISAASHSSTGKSPSNRSRFRRDCRMPGWQYVLLLMLPSLQRVSGVAEMLANDAWRSVRSVLQECVSPVLSTSATSASSAPVKT